MIQIAFAGVIADLAGPGLARAVRPPREGLSGADIHAPPTAIAALFLMRLTGGLQRNAVNGNARYHSRCSN